MRSPTLTCRDLHPHLHPANPYPGRSDSEPNQVLPSDLYNPGGQFPGRPGIPGPWAR
jgi:hypothetical protein